MLVTYHRREVRNEKVDIFFNHFVFSVPCCTYCDANPDYWTTM